MQNFLLPYGPHIISRQAKHGNRIPGACNKLHLDTTPVSIDMYNRANVPSTQPVLRHIAVEHDKIQFVYRFHGCTG
ncbi:MAG: hypothetical protein KatS3mg044_0856 [Rhodothermaceae bacterium]|nr:MAG: hypothetical protein KatS3mg044_0856 [Rhodothermaceae bacterium]